MSPATANAPESPIVPSPGASPLAANPFRSRSDVARAARALYDPLRACISPGGARVRIASWQALFSPAEAEFEGFARPLFALVPLVVGGDDFDGWDRVRDGLVAGSDPDHPEFWGHVTGADQRMVEMAAIGLAMAMVPEQVWDPLPPDAKDRLVDWLQGIERFDPVANNWQFFRIMVQLGLERVGAPVDLAARTTSYDLLDSYYIGDGWYRDGDFGSIDHYVPWAMHAYGLLHAASGLGDADRSAVYRERARAFAPHVARWFDAGGAGLPFGRSLIYRFAQAGFWGALAAADEEALPWGVAKGLYLRHLRYWSQFPIADRDGVLNVGYTYDNRRLVEEYNSPGSPYWAAKGLLGLAAPAEHPFWTSKELPLPAEFRAPTTQRHVPMIVAGDQWQVIALGGQTGPGFANEGNAKYARFAYSTRSGFCGDLGWGGEKGQSDSTIVLHDETIDVRRVRDAVQSTVVATSAGDAIASIWEPWPDVAVRTLLWGGAPWHLRVHVVTSGRALAIADTGFALGYTASLADFSSGGGTVARHEGRGSVWAVTGAGVTAAIDHSDAPRRTWLQPLAPNAHLLWPQAMLPMFRSRIDPGDHVFVSSFGFSPDPDGLDTDGMSQPTPLEELIDAARNAW